MAHSVDLRKRIVALLAKGKTSREIADLLKVGKSTVNDLRRKVKCGLPLQDMKRTGRPRETTVRVDRLIKNKSTQDPWKTANQIAAELSEAGLATVSRMTVSRRLHDVGLFGRVGVKKPFIPEKNRKARLEFAKEHQDWTIEDWKKVAFSDESKFNLFGNDGKQYVRRPRSTRMAPKYCIPTVKYGGGNVKIWGVFSSSGVGPLVLIEGIMTAQVYKNILQNNLVQYAASKMGPDWVFQHVNDPKHTAKIVKAWFESQNINVLRWPSSSPDLNPIEHLWEELKRVVRGRNATNKAHLFEILRVEWRNIPNTVLQNLIESMPRRCAAVIAADGRHTKY